MYMYLQYIFNIYVYIKYIHIKHVRMFIYTHLRIFNQKKEQKILRNAVNNK